MAGCGTGFAKIMLIIFNIIFWLSGAALLGIGIWILLDKDFTNYLDIFGAIAGSGQLLKYAAYVLIAVGGFVLIVGFFGCCGAIKENRCMLGVYIVLLVLIMALEITAGVLAIIYKDKLKEEVTDKLEDTLIKNYRMTGDTQKAFTEGVNFAQVQLKCCGMKDYNDYTAIEASDKDMPIQCCKLQPEAMDKDPEELEEGDVADLKGCRDKVPGTLHEGPFSCCVLKVPSKDVDVATLNITDVKDYARCKNPQAGDNKEYNYEIGCIEGLQNWATMRSTILIGVGIGIACLELFGFIFAVCLCRSIGDDD